MPSHRLISLVSSISFKSSTIYKLGKSTKVKVKLNFMQEAALLHLSCQTPTGSKSTIAAQNIMGALLEI